MPESFFFPSQSSQAILSKAMKTHNKHNASLSEIFSSRQGEGPYVGETMTFVRFGHCALNCKWCDSPDSLTHQTVFQVETPPTSEKFNKLPNPVSIVKLNELLLNFHDPYLSITGGEPLEQVDFLQQWLPSRSKTEKTLLETSGILTKAYKKIIQHIDITSMDIKLPSSTGMKAYWKEHNTFLQTALEADKEIYVKMIVTNETKDVDISIAIKMVNNANRFIPVIIQPVSPTDGFAKTISADRLSSIERICQAYLPDVRVIPQMHKEWGVL
jgi:organic radical activating enzyme